MSAIRRRRPQLEVLEDRCFLDATPLMLTPSSGTTGLMDPTLNPSDPSATSVQVTVSAVGEPVNGQIFSVTVQGLTSANLQPGSAYKFVLGGTSYTVSTVSALPGGGYQLLFTTGIPASQVTVGTTGTLAIGGGATTPTTTAAPSSMTMSSSSLIMDTTLSPTR